MARNSLSQWKLAREANHEQGITAVFRLGSCRLSDPRNIIGKRHGVSAMRYPALITAATAALLLTGASSASAGDIGRDVRDIRHDRADIHHDYAKLRDERRERNYDLKREFQAIERGNFRAAERWDARRRQEQRDVNTIKRDLRRDQIDLARDRADLRRDLRHD
jgi:hypothetical protein